MDLGNIYVTSVLCIRNELAKFVVEGLLACQHSRTEYLELGALAVMDLYSLSNDTS